MKKTIIFDTETTGLDCNAEILQISIIDGEGNVLINSYVKPEHHDDWNEAMAVNGITPEMVSNAPTAEEIIPQVKKIFEQAAVLVAYNNNFDLQMLNKWGIEVRDDQEQFDVMIAFAEIYGEWNEFRNCYKWQKLTKCAEYYGYQFHAHDSLEDVKATLYCYNQIRNG